MLSYHLVVSSKESRQPPQIMAMRSLETRICSRCASWRGGGGGGRPWIYYAYLASTELCHCRWRLERARAIEIGERRLNFGLWRRLVGYKIPRLVRTHAHPHRLGSRNGNHVQSITSAFLLFVLAARRMFKNAFFHSKTRFISVLGYAEQGDNTMCVLSWES